MGIECSKKPDGGVTLKVRGRFDFGCYQQFNAALAGPAAPRYLVDLSGAESMDSAALGMLMVLRDKVGQDAARVQIVSGTGQPSDVLKLANFHQLFKVV